MDLADIRQHLHDSEINASVSWFFDAGFTRRIGDELNGWRAQVEAPTAEEADLELAEVVFSEFPRSGFATWWKEHCARHRAAPVSLI